MVCLKGWIQVTQSMPSHKPDTTPTSHKTILSHKPSLHTHHHFTKTIPSHKPDNITLSLYYGWKDVLCEAMVCVKGWITYCLIGVTSQRPETIHWHKPFILLCITYYLVCMTVRDVVQHPFTQTIPSYQPFLHTNQIICNTKNDKWFVWRNGLCLGSVMGLSHFSEARHKTISWNKLSIPLCIHIVWFVWRNGLC